MRVLCGRVVPSIEAASGAGEGHRWAALNPSRGCRTVPAARHHQAYSGHIRTYPGIVEYEMIIAYRIVRRRIAYRRARRRIACRRARRRIACGQARREIASHHSAIRFGDLGVPAMPTVGHPEGPSSAMPRPNSACSRRRQPLCANIFSLVRRGASSLPVRRRG